MLADIAVNNLGHLTWGGVDTVFLAKKYGTPLYVVDLDMVEKRALSLKKAMQRYYPAGEVTYAAKALFCKALSKLIAKLGLSLDVVSGGELYVALESGFPTKRIYFHGNNKSAKELEMAVKNNVGTIVVDNWYELALLEEIAAKEEKIQKIFLRVAPGIEAHTHVHIQTGKEDSKFGFTRTDSILAAKKALASKHLSLNGIHCHVGSQITNLASFTLTAKTMAHIKEEIEKNSGFILPEIDIGGGLGIQYLPEDPLFGPDELIEAIYRGLPNASVKLHIEPGRYLVGQAGITLYTTGAQKEIPGVRKYVAIDGGMTDNPRVALYGAEYYSLLANKPLMTAEEKVSIAGKCCESGDMLIYDANLPKIEAGDILAVFSTGAYNYSMASNYNMLPRPAMVFVSRGEARLVVRRETYNDLLLRDVD